MSDFDAKTILQGSVPTVSAQLDGFTLEQLTALHDAEEAREGGARTTMLAAIHSAVEAKNPPPPAPPEPPADPEPEPVRKGALVLADLPDPTALKEMVDYHGAVTVVLADAEDVPIADWPPLEFPADKIEAAENGVRLTEQIDMAAELPPAQVKAFWLTVGGDAVAVARLAVPLPAGGGRRAQMGASSLRFRNDG